MFVVDGLPSAAPLAQLLVTNPAPQRRRDVAVCGVPIPRGRLSPSLVRDRLVATNTGLETPEPVDWWVAGETHSDGSARWVEVALPVLLDAGQTRIVDLSVNSYAPPRTFVRHPAVTLAYLNGFAVRLRHPWGEDTVNLIAVPEASGVHRQRYFCFLRPQNRREVWLKVWVCEKSNTNHASLRWSWGCSNWPLRNTVLPWLPGSVTLQLPQTSGVELRLGPLGHADAVVEFAEHRLLESSTENSQRVLRFHDSREAPHGTGDPKLGEGMRLNLCGDILFGSPNFSTDPLDYETHQAVRNAPLIAKARNVAERRMVMRFGWAPTPAELPWATPALRDNQANQQGARANTQWPLARDSNIHPQGLNGAVCYPFNEPNGHFHVCMHARPDDAGGQSDYCATALPQEWCSDAMLRIPALRRSIYYELQRGVQYHLDDGRLADQEEYDIPDQRPGMAGKTRQRAWTWYGQASDGYYPVWRDTLGKSSELISGNNPAVRAGGQTQSGYNKQWFSCKHIAAFAQLTRDPLVLDACGAVANAVRFEQARNSVEKGGPLAPGNYFIDSPDHGRSIGRCLETMSEMALVTGDQRLLRRMAEIVSYDVAPENNSRHPAAHWWESAGTEGLWQWARHQLYSGNERKTGDYTFGMTFLNCDITNFSIDSRLRQTHATHYVWQNGIACRGLIQAWLALRETDWAQEAEYALDMAKQLSRTICRWATFWNGPGNPRGYQAFYGSFFPNGQEPQPGEILTQGGVTGTYVGYEDEGCPTLAVHYVRNVQGGRFGEGTITRSGGPSFSWAFGMKSDFLVFDHLAYNGGLPLTLAQFEQWVPQLFIDDPSDPCGNMIVPGIGSRPKRKGFRRGLANWHPDFDDLSGWNAAAYVFGRRWGREANDTEWYEMADRVVAYYWNRIVAEGNGGQYWPTALLDWILAPETIP